MNIGTMDENLYDRMDAALCKALDSVMGDEDFYSINISWIEREPDEAEEES